LSSKEKKLVEEIREKTTSLNENNITRTKAYLDFYRQFSEVHWSFLAHMVSRNAGWNMTDLKGSFLSRILKVKQSQSFFSFLERGNWLIFQDAFPQLLLYEETRKTGDNLFFLLPHFHVSYFMEVIWQHFLKTSRTDLLTNGLIINEQNYIQQRLLKNTAYKKETIHTLEFQLQDILSMNQLIFPYIADEKVQLLGDTLHFFESLPNRILFGKKLYKILFGEQINQIKRWAIQTAHTGSRKDFWPHLFNDLNEKAPNTSFKPSLQDCKLLPGSSRLYSPKLTYAWPNVIHDKAEVKDWYHNWHVINELIDYDGEPKSNITKDYCETLKKQELAIIAKQILL
ncbi:MAG: DUF2515 family protein, partial [Lysinibacillus sp.]